MSKAERLVKLLVSGVIAVGLMINLADLLDMVQELRKARPEDEPAEPVDTESKTEPEGREKVDG